MLCATVPQIAPTAMMKRLLFVKVSCLAIIAKIGELEE